MNDKKTDPFDTDRIKMIGFILQKMERFDLIKVLLRSSPQQADVHRTSASNLFKSLFKIKTTTKVVVCTAPRRGIYWLHP